MKRGCKVLDVKGITHARGIAICIICGGGNTAILILQCVFGTRIHLKCVQFLIATESTLRKGFAGDTISSWSGTGR